MNAGQRAKVVKQARTWLGRADDAGFLARALVFLDAQLTAVEKERDEAIDSRATLRSAWNHHADNCEQFKTPVNLPTPTLDDIREWMTAPSATASALGPEHTVSYWRQRAVAAEKERDEWKCKWEMAFAQLTEDDTHAAALLLEGIAKVGEDEWRRLREIEKAARRVRSNLYVPGKSHNEAEYEALQALDAALSQDTSC